MLKKNLVIRISEEDWKNLMTVKGKGVNISQVIRNFIKEFLNKKQKI